MSLLMMPTTTDGWTEKEFIPFAYSPWQIHVRAVYLQRHRVYPLHSHDFHQLIYAAYGSMIVTFNNTWHITSKDQALWIPRGTQHTTGSFEDSELCNLYVTDSQNLHMPKRGTAFRITPLMRALMFELRDICHYTEEGPYISKISSLILEQLHRLPEEDFHLSWPENPSLRRICQELYANPACPKSFEEWGKEMGISPRTLMRRFIKELGMPPSEWRIRLRLFKAIDLLRSDDTITEIALQLGYATASAFTYMFHQKMGCTPSEWRRR